MLFIFFKIDIFVGMFSGCENHEALASAIVSQCCTKLIGTIFTTTRKWVSKNKIRTRKISDEYEQIVSPFYMIVTNMSEFMPEYHSKCFEIIIFKTAINKIRIYCCKITISWHARCVRIDGIISVN